jgi:Fe(3+) dicitrate transport protein
MLTNTEERSISMPPAIKQTSRPRLLTLAISSLLFPALSHAEVPITRIDVIGEGIQAINTQAGSVGLVTREELDLMQPMSTEDALRGVAGVAIKGEEESAIVANIGIRGLSAADYKSLILEDGVPVAPGLFVGNGRYYNPRIQRMEGIEVLKGAASLRYGPNTIGGVINYKTRAPVQGVTVSSRAGSFGYREGMIEAGGTSPSGDAVGGISYTYAQSDGFQNKGYEMNDLMIKTGLQISDNQTLSAKFTRYTNDANISYRGLFLDDYRARRTYNPAPDDWYLTGRTAFDVNYEWRISDNVQLNSVAYWSEMYRDYWRFDVDQAASRDASRWVYTDSITGNNRSFNRLGIDTRLNIAHDSFGVENRTEIGVRMDTESMDNLRERATRTQPRAGVIDRNIEDSAGSIALYAQNRFLLTDRLALTPGVRVEHYEQKTDDRRNDANDGKTTNTEVMPGLGATYELTPVVQLYGSVYEAFSPAQNSAAIAGGDDQRLSAENSRNMELGIRGFANEVAYELTAFRMEFSNQIVPAISNIFVNSNGGETLHQGMEASLGYGSDVGLRFDANATWVRDARFVGDRLSSDGSVSTTRDGNRVPYTPELVANLRIGYQIGALNTSISAHFTGQQYTDAENSVVLTENTSGFFTGRIDAYTTLDLNAVYSVSDQFTVFGAVRNLTDRRYIASLRQGIYAGPSRSLEVGGRYRF